MTMGPMRVPLTDPPLPACGYQGFGSGDQPRGQGCTLPIGHQGPCASSPPETKLTNPKDAVGSDKLPIHLWPESATSMGCLGLLDGMLKYGRANWREAGVRATIYIDAARRHLAAYAEGEDLDPDSELPHLAHALACLAILVDSAATDQLVDDRSYRGHGYRRIVTELTPHVARLKQKHADKNPKHYTIGDEQ